MIPIKFKEYLNEYRKVPQAQPLDPVELINMLDDNHNVELLRCHISIKKMDLIILEKTFSSKIKILILRDRLDKHKIIGYMYLEKVLSEFHNLFRVMDVTIYEEFQNLGLGSELYLKVITIGKFNLVNGFSLSNNAVRIWQRLKEKVTLSIWDAEEDKIYDLADSPNLPENDKAGDADQRWFYVASNESILENWLPSSSLGDAYEIWLNGKTPYGYGSFRHSREFEDGI